jgi:hypothetical protein
MTGKLFIAALTLLAATASYAVPSGNDGWTRETRQLGNKVSIDVYHRSAYALTGKMAEPARRAEGRLMHETRQLGSKVTIDVYRR